MSWEGMSGYQRVLVETVIDSSLRSLTDDPKRSLRKLVDLGESCAGRAAAKAVSADGAGYAGKRGQPLL